LNVPTLGAPELMAAVSHERLLIHQSKAKQETIGLPKVIDNFSGCPLVWTLKLMYIKKFQ
jgi:hypothetical protein